MGRIPINSLWRGLASALYQLDIDHFMKVLRCPFYAGAIRIKNWPPNDNALHEALISLDQYEVLQAIISKRKPKFKRTQNNPDFPLSSLMTCTDCGGKLVGFLHRNGKGGTWYKYRCRGECHKQHRRDLAHKGLDRVLAEVEVNPDARGVFLTALTEVWESKQQSSLQRVTTLEREIAKLKSKKNKLIVSLSENPDLKEDIQQAITEVKASIAEAELDIAATRDIEKDLVEFIAFTLNHANNLMKNFWKLEHKDRVRCKQLVFPSGFSINAEEKVYTPEISVILRLAGNKKRPRK